MEKFERISKISEEKDPEFRSLASSLLQKGAQLVLAGRTPKEKLTQIEGLRDYFDEVEI